ncbi:MAG: ATP-binding protein [Pseudomonadota bacterium]
MNAQRAEIIAEIERRRVELNLGLVRIYNYYRTLVGMGLLAVFAQTTVLSLVGSARPTWFWWIGIGYTLINVGSILATQIVPHRWMRNYSFAMGFVMFDVLVLVALTYCSSGITSGLAALILVTIATGAVIIPGRRATFTAALATVALLYEEFYLSLTIADASADFFQAGVFGALYFAVSLSIQSISSRVRQNDIRTLTQAAELADLERLNRQIIQRMRTGIVVIDQNNAVRLYNQSARALLGTPEDAELNRLPPTLLERLNTWRENTAYRTPPFQVDPQAPSIRVNFAPVRNRDALGDVTIFLEDTGEVAQQAQQLKLAELGRLSASIAHEVRNPLGAISHAAQLLNESDELTPPDQRLTDIIINHCKRMNGVVESVLELSRRQTPQPERLQLQAYLENFATTFAEAVTDAQIDIEVAPTTEIRVDPNQLNQALTNLVDNGLRYSADNNAGQRVRLEGGIDGASERPYLNVIDFGTGVDPEMEAQLFQPFETTSHRGTGLGLYISRELCEANQAQISYFRHAQGGSCFRILFAHPERITV